MMYSKDSETKKLDNQTHFASYPIKTLPQPRVLPFALTEEPKTYHGYANGYRQPVACLTCRIAPMTALQLSHVARVLKDYVNNDVICHAEIDAVSGFAEAMIQLQKNAGLPIFEGANVTANPMQPHLFTVWIPMLFASCFHPIAAFLIRVFNHHVLQTTYQTDEAIARELVALIDSLKPHAPHGFNSVPLLNAAFEKHIPWRHLARNTFQYGMGRHSRWLDSTFTDKTAHIPSLFAENKRTMAAFLSQAGFPVTEQYVVHDAQTACNISEKMGYPVVIKPLDRHSGLGVYPYLLSPARVKKAFELARQHTQTVLLEKHVMGKDYRMLVLNGRLFWAIERVLPGVYGDGMHTVAELVEQHNQAHERYFPLRQLILNDAAHDCLLEQGVKVTSIPQAGRFIVLSRIANIAAGGTPIGVMDKVHPDNQKLMESVATLLRLDFVGIDFIIPDIQQSYREVGGSIIEVNVQPRLGSTTFPGIYQAILSHLVKEEGRIPIVVVIGDVLLSPVQKQLINQYENVGIASTHAAMINGVHCLDTQSAFMAGQHLLCRDDIDALIYHVTDNDIQQHGLPFDRFDYLFMTEKVTDVFVVNTLSKACLKEIFILDPDEPCVKSILNVLTP